MAKILVLDDDTTILEMIATVLEGAGHEVVKVADGWRGLRASRETPFDLAIVDIIMPGRDGIETIRSLRRHDPGLRILAISGDTSGLRAVTNLDAARKLGADSSLAKPFGAADLRRAVGALLGPAGA